MINRTAGATLVLAAMLAAPAPMAQTQRSDYLSQIEADKIRDAETTDPRIRLFIEFAADRLKKFNYERTRTIPDPRRLERMKAMLEAYSGCVDDAAELLDLGREKQEEIHKGIKAAQAKLKEYAAELEKIKAAPGVEQYAEELEDAIAATKSAQQTADKAAKEIAPPPVRRKQ